GLNLLESLNGWAGPRLSPLLPALALTLWLAALVVAVAQLRLAGSRLASLLAAALLGTLGLAETLSNLPLVAQSLYWSQGMGNYVPPLILATLLAALLVYAHGHRSPPRAVRLVVWGLAGLIPFVAGGFSEMYTAAQLAALIVLAAAVWLLG